MLPLRLKRKLAPCLPARTSPERLLLDCLTPQPLLSPILQLVLMLSVLGTMKMTDLILVLTNGGPGGTTEVVMTYIFKYFFSYGDNAARDVQFGYASAMAVVTAVILGITTLIYLRVSRKMQSYDE